MTLSNFRTFVHVPITIIITLLLIASAGIAEGDADNDVPQQTTVEQRPDDLQRNFGSPPDSAEPWVYWFWMNGNVTREGITADLEAMERVGIGGVLIMEVARGKLDAGPVVFGSEEWRELFKHAVAEADRLGLKVRMNSGSGWTLTGGPWIEPEHAMKEVTFTKTSVPAGEQFDGSLPEPSGELDVYRDIAVLAFPEGKTVARDDLLDLTPKMNSDGRLKWKAPALDSGEWTIIRFGYTPTGEHTTASPYAAKGLYCDVMSKQAVERAFDGFLGNLIEEVGPLAGKTFTGTHIDSWEGGMPNWTTGFDKMFKDRRGYEIRPYLPVLAGYVVESEEVTGRFRRDFKQTISDLIADNYAGHMRKLAHKNGMRLSMEAFKGMRPKVFDEVMVAGRVDEPMCEFWSLTGKRVMVRTARSMASAAHTYGAPIVAAEAFTAGSQQRFRSHPARLKPLGDRAFCDGVNRFIIHCYPHQPWPDRNPKPGVMMGPNGIHYERTQTWFDLTPSWHEYVARSQYMLRQGHFVADICYLRPEIAPQGLGEKGGTFRGETLIDSDGSGYGYDVCSAEVVVDRMQVEDGRLVLSNGISYSLLVLPDTEAMTPELLRKLNKLADDGARIVGPLPERAAGLRGYPEADAEVARLAEELEQKMWREDKKTESGIEVVEAGQQSGEPQWIWFEEGNPAQLSPLKHAAPPGTRYFRRLFKIPADRKVVSARIEMAADNQFDLWVNGQRAGSGDEWAQTYSMDVVSLLEKGGNVVAVKAVNAGKKANPAGLIGSLEMTYANGNTVKITTDDHWQSTRTVGGNWLTDIDADWRDEWRRSLEIGPRGATPWGNDWQPRQLYPVPEHAQAALERMDLPPDFQADRELSWIHRRTDDAEIYFVASDADEQVEADCTFRVSGRQPEIWDPMTGETRPAKAFSQTNGRTTVPLRFEPNGSLFVVFRKPVDGAESNGQNFPEFRSVQEIDGSWEVSFDPDWGGPDSVLFKDLVDWTERPEKGIKYYSGKATYRKAFNWSEPSTINQQPSAIHLDLGQVEVIADVKVNGQDCGIAWKQPYRVDITDAVREGENTLEVTVANRWPNRMIGDKFLPEDKRYTWASYDPFTKNSPLLPSGLLGPVRILAEVGP